LRPVPVDRSNQAVIRQRDDETIDTPQEMTEKVLKISAPVLVSAVIHMVLLIILGLWMFSLDTKVDIELVSSFDGPEDMLDSIAATVSPIDTQLDQASMPVVTTIVKTDPFKQTTAVVNLFGSQPTVKFDGAMDSRSTAAQAYMVGKRGGSNASQSAVSNGLKWLADKQDNRRGNWHLLGHDRRDNREVVLNENLQAATAMALLAFQGAGNTHQAGQFKDNVDRGIKFLLAQQTSDGNFCSQIRSQEMMYAQAQCTIAICELLAMTKDERLRDPATKAVNYCIAAQDTSEQGGGWRYQVKYDSDTSVTGWMLVAMKSATYAGIAVPDEVFNHISRYLDSASTKKDDQYSTVKVNGQNFKVDPGTIYSYLPGQAPDDVMTAEAILMRMYLGWAQDDSRIVKAAEFLLAGSMPKWEERNLYYWYYATQMFSHLDGEYWKTWNGVMRDMLVNKQERSGPQKGSWNPLGTGSDQSVGADYWCVNGAGGRHYATCMSLYVLEVYYRHLPIYSLKNKTPVR